MGNHRTRRDSRRRSRADVPAGAASTLRDAARATATSSHAAGDRRDRAIPGAGVSLALSPLVFTAAEVRADAGCRAPASKLLTCPRALSYQYPQSAETT